MLRSSFLLRRTIQAAQRPLAARLGAVRLIQTTPVQFDDEELESFSHDASNTLFIGGLSWDVDEHTLQKTFEQYGTVENVNIITDRDTDRSRGFGFVHYQNVEDAVEGARHLNGADLEGRPIRVDFAAPRAPRGRYESQAPSNPISNKLFVGGISWSTTSDSLRQIFSSYGEVVESKVIYDRATDQSKGFAFVTFYEEESSQKALEALNGEDVDGRQVRIDYAFSQPNNDWGSNGGTTSESVVCFHCNETGHFARDCPVANGGEEGDVSASGEESNDQRN